MIWRPVYDDCDLISQLLYDAGRGKAPGELCLKRARQFIARAAKKARLKRYAYTSGKGFLYAEERHMFDLAETKVVEVHILVGGDAVALLRHLRKQTHQRIQVQSWEWFGRTAAFERLIRPLEPEKVGITLQI